MFKPEFPRWLIPIADIGSTMGIFDMNPFPAEGPRTGSPWEDRSQVGVLRSDFPRLILSIP